MMKDKLCVIKLRVPVIKMLYVVTVLNHCVVVTVLYMCVGNTRINAQGLLENNRAYSLSVTTCCLFPP